MAASKSGSSMLTLANAKSLSMAVVTATKTTLTAKRTARISAKNLLPLWKVEKVNNSLSRKKFATCPLRLDLVEPQIQGSISMPKLENAKCSYMEVVMAMPTISNQWRIAKQDANNRENSHSFTIERINPEFQAKHLKSNLKLAKIKNE